MTLRTKLVILIVAFSLTACGGTSSDGTGGHVQAPEEERETIWDLFSGRDDPDTTVAVNKYLWVATLDVLNFMPVISADPFTGVISMGYGTPPGSGRSYRATVLIQDPALDARSLRVSLQSRGGPVSASTARAVEDAILTRARQLRVSHGNL